MRIKKNDTVIIITGKDKGKTGKVIRVLPQQEKVVVEHANMVKKHQKPTKDNPTGGIVDKEAPIHVSNVMIVDGKTGKGTRTKVRRESDGSAVRIAVKTGTVID